MTNNILTQSQYLKLSNDIKSLIESGTKKAQDFARFQLILTYWQIGKRISQEKLSQNANYSSLILNDLTNDLKLEKTTLRRAIQFFNSYPQQPKETSLTWSHYKYLLAVQNPNLRIELEEKSKAENWNVARLNNAIQNAKTNNEDELKEQTIKRPTDPNYLYKAKIIDVVDGDTLILNIDLGFKVIKEQRIRLNQIDAPEIKTNEGKESFKYLRDLCASLENVVVKTNKIDIYGRYLGDIFYSKVEDNNQTTQIEIFENGVYLNEELVKNNFAKVV